MIKKQGSTYKVKSKDGSKNLGTYKTKKEAEKRIRQVEFYKNKDKKSK